MRYLGNAFDNGNGIVLGDILSDFMADRMTKELVINALLAVTGKHSLEEGCIFHSDRDSQYTSKAFMELLKELGICRPSSS